MRRGKLFYRSEMKKMFTYLAFLAVQKNSSFHFNCMRETETETDNRHVGATKLYAKLINNM